MTASPARTGGSSDLLDRLEAAAKAATVGTWQWEVLADEGIWANDPAGFGGSYVGIDLPPDLAACIVAEHNAAPALVAALRAVLALADELEREATKRNQIADRLPNQLAYHMEVNRLVVAAEHQRRCGKRLRRILASALGASS